MYLIVKKYSAYTEFALKSTIVYFEITVILVLTESNLGHRLFFLTINRCCDRSKYLIALILTL